jgi:hypothetical protein
MRFGSADQLLRQRLDRVFEADRFARGAVEMHAGEFATRSDFADFDVDHVVRETKHFPTDLENAAANLDDIASNQLALVAEFCCTAAMPRPLARR